MMSAMSTSSDAIQQGDTVTIGNGKVHYRVTFVADEGATLMTVEDRPTSSGRRHLGYVELSRLRKVQP